MTWNELIERTLFGFPAEKRSLLKHSAYTYLKDAQEDFVIHTKCLEFSFQSTLQGGTFSIELPETFLQVQRIGFEGKTLSSMPVWSDIQLKDKNENWVQGFPEYYFIQGQTLYLYPAPSTAGELIIWCEGVFGSATDTSWETLATLDWENYTAEYGDSLDTPYIPFEYHKYLIDYARSEMFSDEGDINKMNVFQNKYAMNREMVRKIYLRRKVPVKSRVFDAVDSQITHREVY